MYKVTMNTALNNGQVLSVLGCIDGQITAADAAESLNAMTLKNVVVTTGKTIVILPDLPAAVTVRNDKYIEKQYALRFSGVQAQAVAGQGRMPLHGIDRHRALTMLGGRSIQSSAEL